MYGRESYYFLRIQQASDEIAVTGHLHVNSFLETNILQMGQSENEIQFIYRR